MKLKCNESVNNEFKIEEKQFISYIKQWVWANNETNLTCLCFNIFLIHYFDR